MSDGREAVAQALSGTYAIERELGGGGMSRVFVATETALRRRVVIKLVSVEGGVTAVERFRREILTVASLTHPHIVPVLAAGEADGQPWFAMPFVTGESLRARLASGGALPVADALKLLRDVAQALAYAHGQGFVHRDIKPDNVLMADGAAMVTDFGVAKALSNATGAGSATGTGMTGLGMALGTPAYMAPEQVSADPTVDHRADVYAWGIMAYEVLSGVTPFGHRTAQQLFAAHLTETPALLRTRRAEVPMALELLVAHCLEKDPAKRPQSARELLAALDAIPTAEAVATAHGASAVADARGRGRGRVAVVAGVGLLAAVGAWVLLRARSAGASELDRSVIVLPFENVGGDSTQEFFSDGVTDEIIGRLATTGLRVAGRNTAYSFKGQHPTARQVGATAGVATVLSGRVRRLGDAMKVTLELARTSNDSVIWTYGADRSVADLESVQREIVDSIVARFRLRAPGAVVQNATTSVRAHDFVMRGRFATRSLSLAGINQGLALFDSALALDSMYAPAHLGKADALFLLGDAYGSPALLVPRALPSLERALALDSTSAQALGLAAVLNANYRYDFARLPEDIARARARDPKQNWALFSEFCLRIARGDPRGALAMADTMERADPVDVIPPTMRLYLYTFAGRGDSALAQWQRTSSSARTANYGDVTAGFPLLAAGRLDDAVRAFREGEPALGHPSPLLGVALARLGRTAESRAQLQKIERDFGKPYFPPELVAMHAAALGDTTAMYRWLETGLRERSSFMYWVGLGGPELGPHLNEPHFKDIMKRFGMQTARWTP